MQLKISFPVKFNKAKFPSKKKLIGKYCFLEPINVQKHSKDLFKNFSLDKKEDLELYPLKYNTCKKLFYIDFFWKYTFGSVSHD